MHLPFIFMDKIEISGKLNIYSRLIYGIILKNKLRGETSAG